jgi:hypothetical protein
MGTGNSFPGGKAAGVWSWPLTSNKCRGQENVDLYIQSPIRHHGIVHKHKDNFILCFYYCYHDNERSDYGMRHAGLLNYNQLPKKDYILLNIILYPYISP